MPDSPESPGFLEATKKIQAKTEIAAKRNSPAAAMPARENLMTGTIAIPSNPVRELETCQAVRHSVRFRQNAGAEAITNQRMGKHDHCIAQRLRTTELYHYPHGSNRKALIRSAEYERMTIVRCDYGGDNDDRFGKHGI